MAGSKAPKGSLKALASSTEKGGRSSTSGLFSNRNAPSFKPKTVIGDDSGTSSESESDSDSDGSIKKVSNSDFLKRVSGTPSKSKINGAKSKDDMKTSKTATPAKSPTVNGLTASVKKERSKKDTKKEDTPTSSESESESGSDEKAKKGTASAKGKEVKKNKSDSKSDTSSSSESESDSDSSSSDSSSSESESEEEEDSEDAAQQIEEQIRSELKTASQTQSSSSEEPNKKKAKSSKTKTVSVDDDGDVEMMDESMALTNGGNATHVGDVPEFVAPDFHLRKLDANADSSDVANFFSKAQLEGKQVWYITAPASLPVTVVQDLTIPMDQAQKGLPVLTHNGDAYRMAFDNPAASSSFRLLIPNKKGEEYSLLERPVNQTMHFTRSETFPPEGPAILTTTQTVSTTKPARPQPEGLRARFTPVGVPSPKPTITPIVPPKNKAVVSSAAQDNISSSSTPKGSSKKKRKHRDDGEDGPTAAFISTPVSNKETSNAVPSGGIKKNPPAEKSAKKQKIGNGQTLGKQTPVPVPSTGYSSVISASQPIDRSQSRSSLSPGATLPATQVPVPQYNRRSMSPGATLPATQVPIPQYNRRSLSPGVALPSTQVPLFSSLKQTPIPIPRAGGPSVPPSSSRVPTDAAITGETKQQRKERKKADKEAAKAKAATKDRKVSQIPVPQFVGGRLVLPSSET